jgi:hypothetical protein
MRQYMSYENHLVVVEDLGYQPKAVSQDVEDRIDLFSNRNPVSARISLPNLSQVFPFSRFCRSEPAIQWRRNTSMLLSRFQQLFPADDVQFAMPPLGKRLTALPSIEYSQNANNTSCWVRSCKLGSWRL